MKELKKGDYINDNLCLAGGVFLNILANSVLRKNEVVENIHIPPFPDDTGLSFGAACIGAFKNKDVVKLPHNISLLGKTYSDEEVEKAVEGTSYKKYDDFDELCKVTADLLADNKIIGWFQNRSEFGPRALGSRSILMNPKPKKNKDIVNSRIKHREEWRPFAGIMLEEYQEDYFIEDYPNEYMLYSLVVRPHQRKHIGAITHQDGTCRIQTVNDKLHPEVTTLLQKYKEKTGCPILLNTSFNDNGQPIIETPQDAVDTFNKIDLDYLIIDLPPGTGDIQMALSRLLPQAELIVITTPQLMAQKVATRVADMAKRSFIPLLGVIENMSYFESNTGEKFNIFGEGGGEALSNKFGIPLLGKIPIGELSLIHI